VNDHSKSRKECEYSKIFFTFVLMYSDQFRDFEWSFTIWFISWHYLALNCMNTNKYKNIYMDVYETMLPLTNFPGEQWELCMAEPKEKDKKCMNLIILRI
jgi:hypothetical protein